MSCAASSKPFNFMASCSGLIAIGVADSFSALVGSVYGKHVILKGYKTYEGTTRFTTHFIYLFFSGLSAFFFSYATMAISLAYILHLLNILKSFNFILTLKILFTSMFTAAFEVAITIEWNYSNNTFPISELYL
jgi:dolichol kinase